MLLRRRLVITLIVAVVIQGSAWSLREWDVPVSHIIIVIAGIGCVIYLALKRLNAF